MARALGVALLLEFRRVTDAAEAARRIAKGLADAAELLEEAPSILGGRGPLRPVERDPSGTPMGPTVKVAAGLQRQAERKAERDAVPATGCS